jgi:hypothetical protein
VARARPRVLPTKWITNRSNSRPSSVAIVACQRRRSAGAPSRRTAHSGQSAAPTRSPGPGRHGDTRSFTGGSHARHLLSCSRRGRTGSRPAHEQRALGVALAPSGAEWRLPHYSSDFLGLSSVTFEGFGLRAASLSTRPAETVAIPGSDSCAESHSATISRVRAPAGVRRT